MSLNFLKHATVLSRLLLVSMCRNLALRPATHWSANHKYINNKICLIYHREVFAYTPSCNTYTVVLILDYNKY